MSYISLRDCVAIYYPSANLKNHYWFARLTSPLIVLGTNRLLVLTFKDFSRDNVFESLVISPHVQEHFGVI